VPKGTTSVVRLFEGFPFVAPIGANAAGYFQAGDILSKPGTRDTNACPTYIPTRVYKCAPRFSTESVPDVCSPTAEGWFIQGVRRDVERAAL
jgi:hypothetical protein